MPSVEPTMQMVVDSEDNLHLTFRAENCDDEQKLVYVRRKPTCAPKWIHMLNFMAHDYVWYHVYDHKLEVDKNDWLYLTYWYYSHPQVRAERPILLVSKDTGDTW